MLRIIVVAATLLTVMAAKKNEEVPTPLMARLCQDQACEDEQFPIIDYDQVTGKCHCSAHPCWNDNSQVHHCNKGGSPHLFFSYTKQGKLECGCRAEPHYTSKYIAQVKCPGHYCEGKAPMLDYDQDNDKCFCRSHPCVALDGFAHGCKDPKFPVLNYREEIKDGEHKKLCECKATMKAKTDEL